VRCAKTAEPIDMPFWIKTQVAYWKGLRLSEQRPELKFVDGTLKEDVDDFNDVARSVAIHAHL